MSCADFSRVTPLAKTISACCSTSLCNSLYQCFARIIDRYKSNNVYVLVMELTSNLRKYQRREYYRFSCALDMCARNLEEEEIQALEKNSPYELQPGLPLKHSVIVDISGGGLRFVSTQRYEPGSLILCSYHLVKDGEQKKYEVVGKVLAVRELEKRKGTFEHRVQYYNLDVAIRKPSASACTLRRVSGPCLAIILESSVLLIRVSSV